MKYLNKRKGFTLIEIIISVAIISIIGVVSVWGINLVKKNIKLDKLEQLNDKILLAADVYIESHPEVKKAVNDKGAIIPLNVLSKEGLIDLDGIVDEKDDDYVMALLGSKVPGSECDEIYKEGSWNIGDKTIYICTKSDGSSNLATIEADTNYLKASNQPYYFKGSSPNNYFKIDSYLARGIYIDSDDSIVVAVTGRYFYQHNKLTRICDCSAYNDLCNCVKKYSIDGTWLTYEFGEYTSYNVYRISNSCKISGGTGAEDQPYVLQCS